MTQDTRAIVMILIMAACTFATRLFPFALFGGKSEVAPVIRFLGKALPPAVMSILIVYCVKGVNVTQMSSLIPQAVSIAVVVLLHVWKRNNLLSIGCGTVCYMLLVQLVF